MAKAPSTKEWMEARGINGPKGSAGQPVSAHGKDMPTQEDGANVGFKSVNSQGGEPQGNKGQGKPQTVKKGLHPNNTKKAGTTTKGKAAHMPSKEAIHRRLFGATPVADPKVQSASTQGRSGILSKFEGFPGNQ